MIKIISKYNIYKEKAEICKNRRGLHYLWNWSSQIHRNGQSCRSNLYVRFLKILVIVPFGSVASSTLSGNRMVSHTAVSYFKYFLSVVLEAVTIALSIIVSNAILSYGIFDISGRGTGWTGSILYLLEIYGFVGPNGAGKSTVMKMILSLIQPDAGEVQLLGEKVTSHSYEIFKKVGSIIENPYFYDKMTARQNLELHCEYMGFPNKERIDEVLHLVDLQNVEKKQVCHYSLGMKQRLAIARAILAKPEFLILDEPINALDPEGIREMRTLFQRLNQEDGTTIFISSHILSEVDLLADTIGIIQHGKLLTELPIEEIHKHQTDYISLQVDDVTRVAALLENMRITNFSVLDKEFIHIYDSDISGKALSKAIIENGIGLESMGRKQDTLEDFFFQLTEEEK